jgi:hypothetical protein
VKRLGALSPETVGEVIGGLQEMFAEQATCASREFRPEEATTMTHRHRISLSRRQVLRDAALTLAAVLLAFAAFDDITTDAAATFTAEWTGLAVCGVCLAFVSWRLLRSAQPWLGSLSIVAVIAGVAAGSTIQPGTGPFSFEYLLTVAVLLWFLGLSAMMAAQAWQGAEAK